MGIVARAKTDPSGIVVGTGDYVGLWNLPEAVTMVQGPSSRIGLQQHTACNPVAYR